MDLRRPDNIEGYQHPEDTKYSRSRMYKTFTEGKKLKKTEKFGTTLAGKQYANSGNSGNGDEELCPECNSPVISFCNCGYSDKKCKNSHIWYTDRNGLIKIGNPHS